MHGFGRFALNDFLREMFVSVCVLFSLFFHHFLHYTNLLAQSSNKLLYRQLLDKQSCLRQSEQRSQITSEI